MPFATNTERDAKKTNPVAVAIDGESTRKAPTANGLGIFNLTSVRLLDDTNSRTTKENSSHHMTGPASCSTLHLASRPLNQPRHIQPYTLPKRHNHSPVAPGSPLTVVPLPTGLLTRKKQLERLLRELGYSRGGKRRRASATPTATPPLLRRHLTRRLPHGRSRDSRRGFALVLVVFARFRAACGVQRWRGRTKVHEEGALDTRAEG